MHSASEYDGFNSVSNFGITINSMDGHFLFVNDFFCTMVGYSREELLETNFIFVTHKDDVEKNITLDSLVRDGSIPFFQMKKRYIRKDGGMIHVLLQVGILRGDPDVYIAMVMEIGDIVRGLELEKNGQEKTELGRVIKSLPEGLQYLMSTYEYLNRYKEKNQRKSKHLANMVHELRTPLNIINGFAARLKKRCVADGSDEICKSINYITSGCKKMNQLIVEILDFEMLENGTFSLDTAQFDLSPLLDELVQGLRPYAEEHGLKLSYLNNQHSPVIVVGDAERLSLVFNNLVSNAIKYTEQGEIRVQLSTVYVANEKKVSVRVIDSGIGIEEKYFDALFDEFKKIKHSIKKDVDSIGLGLPIARKITELHGGTISVESTVGQGSTFQVLLPA